MLKDQFITSILSRRFGFGMNVNSAYQQENGFLLTVASILSTLLLDFIR
jgi:hypothetical protein